MATTDRMTNDRMVDKRLAQDDREQRERTNRQAIAWLVFALAVLAVLIGGYYYDARENDRLAMTPATEETTPTINSTTLPSDEDAAGTMYDDRVEQAAPTPETEPRGTLE